MTSSSTAATASTNLSIEEGLRKVRAQTTALKDQYFPGFNQKIAAVPVVGRHIDAAGRQLGISNVFLVLYSVLTAAVLTTRALGTATLCSIGGFAFPAYQTLRAREPKDFVQWISYWMIFTTLNVVEGNTYAFAWIPFWDGLKLGFLLFCSLPHTRGAEFIFRTWFAKLMDGGEGGTAAGQVAAVASSSKAPK